MIERDALVALNMMEGIGPVSVAALMAGFGSASAVLAAARDDLSGVEGVTRRIAELIDSQRDKVDWRSEVEEAGQLGVRIITMQDPEYPESLLKIHDPPLVLYVKGGFEARDSRALGVVGTRRPTYYGRDVAAKLAGQVADAGYTVVSGLAAGIDTIAHKQAISLRGRTIAVMGGGMKHVYPAANRSLADDIAGGYGAVVSEYPLNRQPDKTTFPVRNRIVAGLSKGVLVVEAGLRSGAMITARAALEQGRDVFAVPGRIDSPMSSGTNALIKQGAKLVEGVNDILEEYELLVPVSQGLPVKARQMVLNDNERSIMAVLQQGEQHVDVLIRETGMMAGTVTALLVGLELKRAVRMLPGQMVGVRMD